jgi:PadR family transcriptional regulator, regulatory protein AphA
MLMAPENKTKYAILGLLMTKPMSGYDIKKKIDDKLSFFWHENYGHLYPMLAKLDKEKLVKKEIVSEERRLDRKVYKITDKGKKEFAKWLPRPHEFAKFRSELLLKVFFGVNAEPEITIGFLNREKEFHENLLETYDSIEKEINKTNYSKKYKLFWLIALLNGKFYSNSQILWCNDSIKKIRKLTDADRFS